MKPFLVVLAAVLLAGCSVFGQTEAPPAIALDLQKATLEGAATGLDPVQPNGEESPQALNLENGSLQVLLYTSLEGETASQPYLLTGSAPAGTVVTINEKVLVVDESQSFQVEVALEDGPNLVEVIASNLEGDEVECLLTLYYNP